MPSPNFPPPADDIKAWWQETPNKLYKDLCFLVEEEEKRRNILATSRFFEPNDFPLSRAVGGFNELEAHRRENEQEDIKYWIRHRGTEWVPPVLRFVLENYYQREIKVYQQLAFVEKALGRFRGWKCEKGMDDEDRRLALVKSAMRDLAMRNALRYYPSILRETESVQDRMLESYYLRLAQDTSKLPKIVIYDVGADSQSYLTLDLVASSEVEVVGFGLNIDNLMENEALKDQGFQGYHFMDLNKKDINNLRFYDPEHQDNTVDMIMINFAFCYFTRPDRVLRVMQKKLKRGGKVYVVFRGPCMEMKVIKRWRFSNMDERMNYVMNVFHNCDGWKVDRVAIDPQNRSREELMAVMATNLAPNA